MLVFIGDANLLILCVVKPSQPTIDGYASGSIVKVPYHQSSVPLTCRSNGGKPAATITWYRNGVQITEGITATVTDVGDKTQNTVSVLTIRPTKDDDEGTFTCQAMNDALPNPLQTKVVLSVMCMY